MICCCCNFIFDFRVKLMVLFRFMIIGCVLSVVINWIFLVKVILILCLKSFLVLVRVSLLFWIESCVLVKLSLVWYNFFVVSRFVFILFFMILKFWVVLVNFFLEIFRLSCVKYILKNWLVMVCFKVKCWMVYCKLVFL